MKRTLGKLPRIFAGAAAFIARFASMEPSVPHPAAVAQTPLHSNFPSAAWSGFISSLGDVGIAWPSTRKHQDKFIARIHDMGWKWTMTIVLHAYSFYFLHC